MNSFRLKKIRGKELFKFKYDLLIFTNFKSWYIPHVTNISKKVVAQFKSNLAEGVF